MCPVSMLQSVGEKVSDYITHFISNQCPITGPGYIEVKVSQLNCGPGFITVPL